MTTRKLAMAASLRMGLLERQALAVDCFGRPWNAVEHQTDSQLVVRIEPKVAALAAKGRHSWEPVEIDIELLTSVPSVQEWLGDTQARGMPDANLESIAGALEEAIRSLPNPYRDAALEHFGFTEQEASKQGVREERAAQQLRISPRWYRKPQPKYFGMAPRQYVIALVACAFCGITDPFAYIARREGANEEPDVPQAEQGPTSGESFYTSADAVRESASPSATMVSRDPDHLEVFWVGPENEVLYRWWLPSQGWSEVESWVEPEAVCLAAVSQEQGDEILFGLAPNGRVWYRVWELDHRGWHQAGEVHWLDGVVRGPLATASRGPGMIELLAFDAQGQPCHCWTEGRMQWVPWTTDWES